MALIDQFGRHVDYVRISVTDRCDFRCVYCMAEEMTFLPKKSVLSLEEIERISKAFVDLGVTKIRLTGGEPLIRQNVLSLFQKLGALPGLKELVTTTNGSQLTTMAQDLRDAGLKRLNISLDSLNSDRFTQLTRFGKLEQVLSGIDAAKNASFDQIKLNSVIIKGRNDDEILDLVAFAKQKAIDICFIEEMPLGVITEHNRGESLCSSDEVRAIIEGQYQLIPDTYKTGGPTKYYKLAGSESRVGFISPHSHNFCGDCNRVRVTVEGRLLLCLGNEHSVDLKTPMRDGCSDQELQQIIIDAMKIKPKSHEFDVHDEPQILRFMNTTGG
ncbi:GTP 3',8-cyclase MoaA [Litoribacillus peritrichatus]|uniref:GTP 3',8-cyclase n=1 Tax=Litoribacillus peritrichatus TaxID=718191 RepID=A0ABP7MLN4_9GAMM